MDCWGNRGMSNEMDVDGWADKGGRCVSIEETDFSGR